MTTEAHAHIRSLRRAVEGRAHLTLATILAIPQQQQQAQLARTNTGTADPSTDMMDEVMDFMDLEVRGDDLSEDSDDDEDEEFEYELNSGSSGSSPATRAPLRPTITPPYLHNRTGAAVAAPFVGGLRPAVGGPDLAAAGAGRLHSVDPDEDVFRGVGSRTVSDANTVDMAEAVEADLPLPAVNPMPLPAFNSLQIQAVTPPSTPAVNAEQVVNPILTVLQQAQALLLPAVQHGLLRPVVRSVGALQPSLLRSVLQPASGSGTQSTQPVSSPAYPSVEQGETATTGSDAGASGSSTAVCAAADPSQAVTTLDPQDLGSLAAAGTSRTAVPTQQPQQQLTGAAPVVATPWSAGLSMIAAAFGGGVTATRGTISAAVAIPAPPGRVAPPSRSIPSPSHNNIPAGRSPSQHAELAAAGVSRSLPSRETDRGLHGLSPGCPSSLRQETMQGLRNSRSNSGTVNSWLEIGEPLSQLLWCRPLVSLAPGSLEERFPAGGPPSAAVLWAAVAHNLAHWEALRRPVGSCALTDIPDEASEPGVVQVAATRGGVYGLLSGNMAVLPPSGGKLHARSMAGSSYSRGPSTAGSAPGSKVGSPAVSQAGSMQAALSAPGVSSSGVVTNGPSELAAWRGLQGLVSLACCTGSGNNSSSNSAGSSCSIPRLELQSSSNGTALASPSTSAATTTATTTTTTATPASRWPNPFFAPSIYSLLSPTLRTAHPNDGPAVTTVAAGASSQANPATDSSTSKASSAALPESLQDHGLASQRRCNAASPSATGLLDALCWLQGLPTSRATVWGDEWGSGIVPLDLTFCWLPHYDAPAVADVLNRWVPLKRGRCLIRTLLHTGHT